MSSTKTKSVLLLTMLLLAGVFGFVPAPRAQAASFGLRFTLQVVPTVVPADGGTYGLYVFLQDSNGAPAAAPSDTAVSLFSSDQRTGSVQSTVTILRDTSSAFAFFTTTTTAGSTTVSAVASGIGTGTLDVDTQIPVGYPTSIAVFSLPSALIPGGGESGKLVVQLQDSTGAPARAPGSTVISLSSSNPNVATVPASVIVPLGSTYATIPYTPTNLPGSAIVSASAPGFFSGATTVGVSGPTPSSISLSLLPRVMPADTAASGNVAVALLDPSGFPARANSSITVVLTSSNLSVAYFSDPYLTIPAGSFYGFKTVYSGGLPGATEITAQSSGLATGTADMPAREYGTPADGEVVELQSGPTAVLPDAGTYGGIFSAQLLNTTDGFPVQSNYSNPTTVYFSSSKTLIGSVSASSFVPGNGTYALADYTSTLLVGTTDVTAAANGFVHATISISNSAPPPTRLVLGLASDSLRATGEAYPLLFIQLQDDSGHPAKAPQDTQIFLTSNVTGTTDRYVIISSGSSYATANLLSTSTPYSVNITASGTGFSPVFTVVSTIESFPSDLSVSSSLMPMVQDGTQHQIFIQLQDAEGRPAKPETPVQVFLTTDDPSVATVVSSVFLAAGASYVSAALTLKSPGFTTVTAIAQGYSSGQAQIVITQLPITLTLSMNDTNTVVGTSYQVGITATSEAAAVVGASATATARTGRFAAGAAVTDASGQASFLYSPQTPGSDTLNFTVSLTGFATATVGIVVHVDAYYTVTAKVVDESAAGVSGMLVNLVDAKGVHFNGTSAADGTVTFNNVFWGNATISVLSTYQTVSAKYTLSDFNGQSAPSTTVPVLSATTVTAKYITSYLVTVISAYGTATGTGQVVKGTPQTISVAPTSVSSGFLTSKEFNGWKGTYPNKNATFVVTVVGPVVETATWVDNLTSLYILVAAIIGIVVVVIILFWFLRKRRASTTEPQKEDEFK
ncbi:MAG TPA: hypothetical protein VMS77_09335 [Conexivisphaerales archaeon]|nr:hypothetical protein [Conexivisphaerales archaeon]